MKLLSPVRKLLIAVAVFAGCEANVRAEPLRVDHVAVELIADKPAISPGETVWLGLRIVHDPHWHTYWKNPGDSGLATTLEWTLPTGVTVSDIYWPAPKRIPLGPLINFAYDGDMILPVQLTIADDFAGNSVDLQSKADWLMCEEICIPGEAQLRLSLPVQAAAAQRDSRWQELFDTAFRQIPLAVDWPALFDANDGDIVLQITPPAEAKLDQAIEIFSLNETLVSPAPGHIQTDPGGTIFWRVAKSDYFTTMPAAADFVVRPGAESSARPLLISATAGAVFAPEFNPASTLPASEPINVLLILLFALLGGVLLNLMPCVFPVLALKALALAKHSADRNKARKHGVLYTIGAVVSLTAVGGLLLTLRSAGEAIGWGFQLQLPWVVAGLAYLMTALGLSLSGVFMIGAGWMNLGSNLVRDDSSRSAFFTGVLAVIVASPCTAPFMGPALGAAITLSTPMALLVFAFLALGLALPMLLISWSPTLARWLPKPGAWMEGFKQLMAFPLYLTAIWLLWVLGAQTGSNGMALALAGILAMSFALWVLGRAQPSLWHRMGALLGFALALWAVWELPEFETSPAASQSTQRNLSEPWSAQRLQEIRAQGKPVLVNMTAAWCITCLANERVALSSDAFYKNLQDLGYVYLKGDWTKRDAAITDYLAQFGRNGVPIYLVYPAGGGEPVILPQLLTSGLVVDALKDGVRKK